MLKPWRLSATPQDRRAQLAPPTSQTAENNFMVETNFNEIVHADRGKLLARLPKGARTVCSAGCAGAWYFDWFEECYGPVDRHIGVSSTVLARISFPANVQWIQNSVSDMRDVRSGSIDLLFSGQNIEHLFHEDLVGFLQGEQGRSRRRPYLP